MVYCVYCLPGRMTVVAVELLSGISPTDWLQWVLDTYATVLGYEIDLDEPGRRLAITFSDGAAYYYDVVSA